TNFERPSFQRMIDDIEDGKINCVVTKDYCAIIGLNQKDLENQGILA
ncbi:recombinase, partial [Oscillibacter sp. MCC667]|nr:recombinase [Oscillibacter sp. MCC667]